MIQDDGLVWRLRRDPRSHLSTFYLQRGKQLQRIDDWMSQATSMIRYGLRRHLGAVTDELHVVPPPSRRYMRFLRLSGFPSAAVLVLALAANGSLADGPEATASSSYPNRETIGLPSLHTLERLDAEFGSLSLSPVLLVDARDERIGFNLALTSRELYDAARRDLQVRESLFEYQSTQFAFDARATFEEPAAAIASRAMSSNVAVDALRSSAVDARRVAATRELELELKSAQKLQGESERATAEAQAYRKFADALDAIPGTATAVTQQPQLATVGEPLPGPSLDLATQPRRLATPSAGDLVTSNRAAIGIAAGDAFVQSIFNILGRPTSNTAFDNKEFLFGVSQVAATPGWRTRQGDFGGRVTARLGIRWEKIPQDADGVGMANTIAPGLSNEQITALLAGVGQDTPLHDVYTRIELDRGKANAEWSKPKIILPERRCNLDSAADCHVQLEHVSVAAVLPMSDGSLRESERDARRASDAALRLAAAYRGVGTAGDANAALRLIKQAQDESKRRDVETSIAAFAQGASFGVEIGPVMNSANKFGNDRGELQRQSFPVLLVLAVEKGLTDPGLRFMKFKDNTAALVRPVIVMDQVPSWSWSQPGFWRKVLVAWLPFRGTAGVQARKLSGCPRTAMPSLIADTLASARIADLCSRLAGSRFESPLPLRAPPDSPQPADLVKRTFPESFTFNKENPVVKLTLALTRPVKFDPESKCVKIHPQDAADVESLTAGSDGPLLELTLRLRQSIPFVVLFNSCQGIREGAFSGPIAVAPPPAASRSLTVTSTVDGRPSRTEVRIPEGLNSGQLDRALDVLKSRDQASRPVVICRAKRCRNDASSD